MSAPLPIAILLPHAGLAVPPELVDRLALDEAALFHEADAYTDLIYDFRGRVARWLRFPYARALVDVNRSDSDNHTRPGDGIVKRQTSYGRPVYRPGCEPDPALERALIRRYWQPWHQQLAAIAADPAIRLVLDCHSMAAIGPDAYGDPGALRPRACVANLGDEQAEPVFWRPVTAPPELTRQLAEAIGRALADLPALTPTGPAVAVNRPFAGGWNLWAHGGKAQPWLMIEISRGLYIGAQHDRAPIVPPDGERIAVLRERLWAAITSALSITQ